VVPLPPALRCCKHSTPSPAVSTVCCVVSPPSPPASRRDAPLLRSSVARRPDHSPHSSQGEAQSAVTHLQSPFQPQNESTLPSSRFEAALPSASAQTPSRGSGGRRAQRLQLSAFESRGAARGGRKREAAPNGGRRSAHGDGRRSLTRLTVLCHAANGATHCGRQSRVWKRTVARHAADGSPRCCTRWPTTQRTNSNGASHGHRRSRSLEEPQYPADNDKGEPSPGRLWRVVERGWLSGICGLGDVAGQGKFNRH